MSDIHDRVVDTGFHMAVMTAGAMAILEKALESDRHRRSKKCPYCQAQIGDPCHTRRGYLTHGRYHVERLIITTDGDGLLRR